MSLRLRFIIIFTLLIGFGFYGFTQWVMSELRPRYLESLEEAMVDQAYLLSSIISYQMKKGSFDPDEFYESFQNLEEIKVEAQIYNYLKTEIDMRIYITNEKGIILFDSSGIAKRGENYFKWNDVYLTLRGKYGVRTTRKEMNDPMSTHLYVAAPIKIDHKIVGVITLVKSTQAINAFVTSIRPQFMIAGLLSIIAIILVGFFVSKWIVSPLNQLKKYARKISQGERATLPKSFSRIKTPELDELAQDFSLMKESLEGKKYIENYIENLTHEMKSPLTVIQGSAELLNNDLAVDAKKKMILNIETESLRLKNLIERVLELSHIEKLDQLEKLEEFDLLELVKKNINRFQGQLLKDHIQIDLNFERKITFRGNYFLIEQMFDNLLKNALEFSPENSKILIKVFSNEGQVQVEIIDEGHGIPDYAMEKVFDKFYSLKRPKSNRKSTGLGLSFVKEIVELHQGKIELQNLNPGLKVKIYLPNPSLISEKRV